MSYSQSGFGDRFSIGAGGGASFGVVLPFKAEGDIVQEFNSNSSSSAPFIKLMAAAGIYKDFGLEIGASLAFADYKFVKEEHIPLSIDGVLYNGAYTKNYNIQALQLDFALKGVLAFNRLNLKLGPGFSIPIYGDFDYSERLKFPVDKGTFPDSSRIRNEVSDASSSLTPGIYITGGISYEAAMTKDKRLVLEPEISFSYNIGGIIKGSGLKAINFVPGLNLKYYLNLNENLIAEDIKKDYKLEASVWAEPAEKTKGSMKISAQRLHAPTLGKILINPIKKDYGIIFHPLVINEAPVKEVTLNIYTQDSTFRITRDYKPEDILWSYSPGENIPKEIEYEIVVKDASGSSAKSLPGKLPLAVHIVDDKMPEKEIVIEMTQALENELPEALNELKPVELLVYMPVERTYEMNERGKVQLEIYRLNKEKIERNLQKAFPNGKIILKSFTPESISGALDKSKLYLSFFK